MDKDLLYRFFEGHASLEDMKVVKEWAGASEENAGLLRRERKLFNAMILAGHSRRTDIQRMRNRRNYFIREFLKIASVIVITVSVTVVLFSIGKDNGGMYLAMQTITVPAGQRVNLDLPDGSNVWLNAGTTLDVEVLGTKFNVEAYSARKIFETSLMEGRVKVKLPHDEKNSVILAPNQKTTLIDGRLVVSKIDDYNVYRWKEGLYCFRNKPFADIIKDLEKYYDLKIQMDKKEIAKVALTGKFRISDGLDYALRVLQNDVAFIYQRNRDNDVIHIK